MRLIDADKLAEDIYRAWTLWEKKGEDCYLFAEVITPMLIGQPTIDAEPIVRCKDCINREKTPLSVCISVESAKHSFFCKLTDIVVTEQFYCGDGERETNDN